MKKSNTRRALLMSVLSLVLCISMLVGTTFAWFTDSVTSGRNVIQSGNLDIELEYSVLDGTGAWTAYQPVDIDTRVFDYTLWEPGYTQVAKFKITNAGSLALKYQLTAAIADEVGGVNKDGDTFKLSKHLKYGVTKTLEVLDDRATAAAAATESFDGLNVNEETPLLIPGASEEIGMVITMPVTVGNVANHNGTDKPSIEFGIKLVATQAMKESDSFGNDYDEKATYPKTTSTHIPANTTAPTVLEVGDVTVTVPAGAEAGAYELQVSNENLVVENQQGTVSYDISLLKDGEKVSGVTYPVEINVGTLLAIDKLTHNGNEITVYDYDPMIGIIKFETNSFSPFAVEYTELSIEGKIEDGKITDGIFSVNPAGEDFDPTLAEDDSEYIALDFVKNGKTYYAVSKRSETVILAAGETVPTFENGDYSALVKTKVSGKLYAQISALQSKPHSTVYLLPGTYTEATTVGVYSSMDIMGLGDKEDIKVVKDASNGSNRHLFNCNGQKDDYIQVTIRNMYLEVTCDNIKNNKAEDNAAVQCIRKTKVKCYDLKIYKAPATTTWENAAFYINANNAVGGVKYPAYMYAEDIVMNTTNANYKSKIYATKGSNCYFYHNNLKYADGTKEFTTNSGSIKNVQMAADDWDW